MEMLANAVKEADGRGFDRKEPRLLYAFACVGFLGCLVGWGCLVLGLGVPIGPNSKLSKGFLQMEGWLGTHRPLLGSAPKVGRLREQEMEIKINKLEELEWRLISRWGKKTFSRGCFEGFTAG